MFDWFFELIYNLAALACNVIDIVIKMFRGLIGLDTVNIKTEGGSGAGVNILTTLLLQSEVFQIFFAVFFVAFVIALLFGLVQVVRSVANDEGGKTTPGRVLGRCMKSIAVMIVLPVIVIGGVTASSTLMRGIDSATNGGELNTSIGGGIMAISFDKDNAAMWKEKNFTLPNDTTVYNVNNIDDRQEFIDEVIRKGKYDVDYMRQYVNIKELRYMSLMSVISGFIGLFVIGMGAFAIGTRLWNIVLMFVTSPVNAATIPFDDGARFKIWREIFIGKVLSCYGMILATNIFIRFSGFMFRVEVFSGDSAAFGNMVVQIFIILSGMLCISGANQLFASLIGSNSGGAESEQARSIFRNVMGGSMLAKNAVKGSVMAFRNMPSNAKKMYGGMKSVGAGTRNAALTVGAGTTFLTSKITGKGSTAHDKMMTALQGKNYAGSIEERRQKNKNELQYREAKGMTKKDVRVRKKEYQGMFSQIAPNGKETKIQERFESGGYLGKKDKKK